MLPRLRGRVGLDRLEATAVAAVIVLLIAGCAFGIWAVALAPSILPQAIASPPTGPAGGPTQSVTGARLGGPLSAFDAVYGPEVSTGTWDTTVAGVPVQVKVFASTPGESNDSQVRVLSISITGKQQNTWTEAQTIAITQPFLPTDAAPTPVNLPPEAIPTQSPGADAASGPENIYVSQQLTNSIGPSLFVNPMHVLVAPGTFDWQCTHGTPFCYIAIGINS